MDAKIINANKMFIHFFMVAHLLEKGGGGNPVPLTYTMYLFWLTRSSKKKNLRSSSFCYDFYK